jgi:magnesium chelatase subunit D
MSGDAPLAPWDRAVAALGLLAVAPSALGGLWLRARAGPVRDRFLGLLRARFPDAARIHPTVTDDALYGGLDLAATLATGEMALRDGIIAPGRVLVLTMAERCPPGLAARLARALDDGGIALVALDEAAGDDEGLPPALAERLGLFADLDAVPLAAAGAAPDGGRIAAAQAALPAVDTPAAAQEALARLAASLGIGSLRAPLLALAAARAAAALDAASEPGPGHLRQAAELVFAHRARPGSAPAEDALPPEAPEPTSDTPEGDDDGRADRLPDELLLDAVRTALPPDLLARLAAGRAARSARGASGAGGVRKGNRRGRPLPPRAGHLDGASRLDLVATLRAAAPWQRLRRASTGRDRLLELRPDDLRLKRYQETSDRLLVFAVDASGSAALARLAEAKGAVELLLAEAYVRRDHVALVAFRGTGAEVLLPPTRSLVQTKRRLASLPGGGGTPLATGLRAALDVACLARARGMTPAIALLTDGRANIALDGRAERTAAEADAASLARAIAREGLAAVVVDCGNRPNPALAVLAAGMGARYTALPRADAHRLSAVVGAAVG